MFRSGGGSDVRPAGLAGDRSDVDDSSPTKLNHFRKCGSHAIKGAAQVDGKVPVPMFVICFYQRSTLGNTGVVDHDVGTATEVFFDGFEKPFNAGNLSNVTNQRQHAR